MKRAPVSANELAFHPLTQDRWPDLEQLFGPNGACGGCWCMWWKLDRKDYGRGQGAGNKRKLKASVRRGVEPGFIAYRDGSPIGWCAVEPREKYPVLARSRALAPVDQEPVWSVTCLFVKAGHRRRGLSEALLKHAARFVAERGGRLLEGYPRDTRFSGANAMWTGVARTFVNAGFAEVARRTPTRPIMRLTLRVAARR